MILLSILPAGLLFSAYVTTVQLLGFEAYATRGPEPLSPTEGRIVELLRPRARSLELVLCREPVCEKLAIQGGLFVTLPGREFFVDEETLAAREDLLTGSLRLEVLEKNRVRWIDSDRGDPWPGMDGLLRNRDARLLLAGDELELFELIETSTH